VLRRIFGTKGEEMAGDWRRLHKKELHNLYASPNMGSVIKSKTMRWARHVACMRDARWIKILVGIPKGRDLLGEKGVY